MRHPWIDRTLLGAALLAAWQLAAQTWDPYWISSPLLVLERGYDMVSTGDLWFHARFTVGEALGGFALGTVPACLLAMLLRRHPRAEAGVLAICSLGYALPKTALVPLFILWLGVGPGAKVALVASAVFFIVFYSTLRGVKAVSPHLLMTARVLGATESQVLRQVVWPSVVPYVFGGLRVALPYAVAGAIVGEIISSNRGLGYLAQYGAMDFDTTLIFVALATVMSLVLLINAGVEFAQKRLLQWQSEPSQDSATTIGS